jgi:hypothetical protein
MSMKNSNDTIEPATFRFVAQYLNHCTTISGPPFELNYLPEKDLARKAMYVWRNIEALSRKHRFRGKAIVIIC